ncbi:MAG: hypothetical protein R2939_12640 [Kofleriaceae bacterium]
MLGAEAILHLATSAGELRARVDAGHPARAGDQVGARVEGAALHSFARTPA